MACKVFFYFQDSLRIPLLPQKQIQKNVIDIIFSFNKNYPSKTYGVPVSIIKQVIISIT